MSDTASHNVEAFDLFFAAKAGGGSLDFGDWLDKYLETSVAEYFLMPTRTGYGVGTLFADLLEHFRKTQDNESIKIIETGIKKVLLRIKDNFNLGKMSEIAEAVAQAEFREVGAELAAAALAVGQIAGQEPGTFIAERFKLIDNLDRAIAGVAKLAMLEIEPNSPLLLVCQQLFDRPELGFFASNLFAPLALSRPREWPQLWAILEKRAVADIEMFKLSPNSGPFSSVISTSAGLPVHCYFDLNEIFRRFFADALRKGISLTDFFRFAEETDSEAAAKAIAGLLSAEPYAALSVNIENGEPNEKICVWIWPEFAKCYALELNERDFAVNEFPKFSEMVQSFFTETAAPGTTTVTLDDIRKLPPNEQPDVGRSRESKLDELMSECQAPVN